MQVLSGESNINTATTFYNAVQEKDTKIKVTLVKGKGIRASKNELDKRLYNDLAIPNIQKCTTLKR